MMADPTIFKFDLDYEARDSDGIGLFCATIWAPNARQALADFMRRHAGTKGFVGVEEIDPMPTHVRLDGEDECIRELGFVARACAMSLLCEQSGHTTHAGARAYLAELEAAPKEISKRLLAEWNGEVTTDLARSFAQAAE